MIIMFYHRNNWHWDRQKVGKRNTNTLIVVCLSSEECFASVGNFHIYHPNTIWARANVVCNVDNFVVSPTYFFASKCVRISRFIYKRIGLTDQPSNAVQETVQTNYTLSVHPNTYRYTAICLAVACLHQKRYNDASWVFSWLRFVAKSQHRRWLSASMILCKWAST